MWPHLPWKEYFFQSALSCLSCGRLGFSLNFLLSSFWKQIVLQWHAILCTSAYKCPASSYSAIIGDFLFASWPWRLLQDSCFTLSKLECWLEWQDPGQFVCQNAHLVPCWNKPPWWQSPDVLPYTIHTICNCSQVSCLKTYMDLYSTSRARSDSTENRLWCCLPFSEGWTFQPPPGPVGQLLTPHGDWDSIRMSTLSLPSIWAEKEKVCRILMGLVKLWLWFNIEYCLWKA